MHIPLEQMDHAIALFGLHDRNLERIEEELQVRIDVKDGALHISGEETRQKCACFVLNQMLLSYRNGQDLDLPLVQSLIDLSLANEGMDDAPQMLDTVCYTYRGKRIFCKTLGQQTYVRAIRSNLLTLCIGPAGTGKTYLAIALAVLALKNKEVERIILSRPAVEAGEKLGFLPGDMSQKVDPYLRPLYDALYEMLGQEGYQRQFERGVIEVAPLAFMRGRTLSNAFIILDEAQNTTPEQMKMFLTRMGQNARCVVTGDLTQVDLPNAGRSGLRDAMQRLNGIEDIAICTLQNKDVVRNDLVKKIVDAYEK